MRISCASCDGIIDLPFEQIEKLGEGCPICHGRVSIPVLPFDSDLEMEVFFIPDPFEDLDPREMN